MMGCTGHDEGSGVRPCSAAAVPAIPAAQASTTRRVSRRRLLQSTATHGRALHSFNFEPNFKSREPLKFLLYRG